MDRMWGCTFRQLPWTEKKYKKSTKNRHSVPLHLCRREKRNRNKGHTYQGSKYKIDHGHGWHHINAQSRKHVWYRCMCIDCYLHRRKKRITMLDQWHNKPLSFLSFSCLPFFSLSQWTLKCTLCQHFCFSLCWYISHLHRGLSHGHRMSN